MNGSDYSESFIFFIFVRMLYTGRQKCRGEKLKISLHGSVE